MIWAEGAAERASACGHAPGRRRTAARGPLSVRAFCATDEGGTLSQHAVEADGSDVLDCRACPGLDPEEIEDGVMMARQRGAGVVHLGDT